MKNKEELQAWLSLLHVSGVGTVTFKKLLDHFEYPEKVFEASIDSLQQAGISSNLASKIRDNTSFENISKDLSWLEQSKDHHILTLHCKHYPALLKQISDPPPVLFVHGNVSLLNDPQLAIVGSRNPTQSGITAAYDFAKHMGGTGLCITSGLALGIDGMAHQGALDANGPTIAVIATGIDRVYPAKHRDLAHQIVKSGVIISEFPIGTPPKAQNFPRRNRIISGLAHGTLVVEAALRSGSLITARLASEQGREVFAIPGSIHNPLARGCHQLIRQGAKLVENGQDILEEMAAVIDVSTFESEISLVNISEVEETVIEKNHDEIKTEHDDETTLLLEKMGFDPVAIDELVTRTMFSPEVISAMLLMLELQNRVSSNGGGTYTRLK